MLKALMYLVVPRKSGKKELRKFDKNIQEKILKNLHLLE